MSTRSAIATAGTVVALAAAPAMAGTPSASSPAGVRASLRSELNGYLSTRSAPEHISAVSLAVTFRGHGPSINMALGSTRYGGGHPVSTGALWQIGSNTKAFTAVIVLQLEAEHKLSLNDTVGKWLPRYRAWRRVTIKRLLNMTSGLLSYTAVPAFWSACAVTPDVIFSPSRLVSYAYAYGYPPIPGYYYSNTNYILAQMIIERASHDSYGDQLRKRIIGPLGLHDMFFSATTYGRAITARMPAGYWFVAENAQMTSQLGKDQTRRSLSWGQGTGGIVSSLQDMAKWDRALYTGRLLARKQQRELESLISQKTGRPIARTTLADPSGFGLGIEQTTKISTGTVWNYEGETNGFRVIHIYAPRSGALIAVGVNSAAAPANDHLGRLAVSVYQVLRAARLG